MSRCKLAALFVVPIILVGVWAGVAEAHVTVDPASAPKGAGDQVITLRVPNEMDSANTVGLKAIAAIALARSKPPA